MHTIEQRHSPLGLPRTTLTFVGCLLFGVLWATSVEAQTYDCYDASNIGTVGQAPPCTDMLIVCFYSLNYPDRNSCPSGKEQYSIHWPYQTGESWFWDFDPLKNDFYKDVTVAGGGTKRYYFGQHDDADVGQIFTGQVTNMRFVFSMESHFNADISNWDTSQVTDMRNMFYGATAFNQDISNWDTSKVTNMAYMFNRATAFNQDIGDWDTSQVANMVFMFEDASAFNQDLSHWDFSGLDQSVSAYSAILLAGMFYKSSLSVDNYDAFLINFKQERLDLNGENFAEHRFTGGTSRFCESAALDVNNNNYQDLAYVDYWNVQTIYDCSPRIIRVTLDAPASGSLTLTVTFSEPVFTATYTDASGSNGVGTLEAGDFTLDITSTAITGVTEADIGSTPTSISQNGNSYTLGVTITGTLQDDQVIKVLPVTVFDADGNVASDS